MKVNENGNKRRYKISEEKIREYVKKNPKAYQSQMARDFNVTKITMANYLKRYNIKLPRKYSKEKP